MTQSILRRCALTGLSALLIWNVHAATPADTRYQQEGVQAERRVALVIGNSAYSSLPLKNPVGDARALSSRLRDLGFQVTLKENLGFRNMLDAMQDFVVRNKSSDVRLIFYAGHGFQVGGRNFLVPVDADLSARDSMNVRYASADLNEFVDRLDQIRHGVNIVIVDACRRDPLAVGMGGRGRGLGDSTTTGFAQMVAPQGTLIAFSTSPGTIASDGSTGNSPYIKHLLANIGTASLPVEQMFKRVRVGVAKETQQSQVPWETSSLTGDFCFQPLGSECGQARVTAAIQQPGAAAERSVSDSTTAKR